MMRLDQIFLKNGCDKYAHHYYKEYAKEFEPIREEEINILEVGIWKGTSHQSWVDYFPNANVYGIDIFSRVEPKDVSILQHDRVHWVKGDSTSKDIVTKVKEEFGDIKFDYIIDDGLHTPKANMDTVNNLWNFLIEGGVFYVEDVWPIGKMTESEMRHPWIQKHPDRYNIEDWDKFESSIKDLNVSKKVEIDFRNVSTPDSVIIKLVK